MTVNFCHNVGIEGVVDDLPRRVGVHSKAGGQGKGQGKSENFLHSTSPFPENAVFRLSFYIISLFPLQLKKICVIYKGTEMRGTGK